MSESCDRHREVIAGIDRSGLSSQCTCDLYKISEKAPRILFDYLEMVREYISEALGYI